MLLSRTDDPRDALERATRRELELFAQARGVTEVDPRMGAILMRQILRAKGVTDILSVFPHLGRRVVGQAGGVNASNPFRNGQNGKVVQVDATEDLMRQWREQLAREGLQPAPAPQPMPAAPTPAEKSRQAKNKIAALREECKRRGIKMSRTDKLADLRAKLDGENANSGSQ
jgi:hypothetical protein